MFFTELKLGHLAQKLEALVPLANKLEETFRSVESLKKMFTDSGPASFKHGVGKFVLDGIQKRTGLAGG